MYQQNVNGMSEYMGFMSGAEKFAGRKEAEELERRKAEAQIGEAEAGAAADRATAQLRRAQARQVGREAKEDPKGMIRPYLLIGQHPDTGTDLASMDPAAQLGYLMTSYDPKIARARDAGVKNVIRSAVVQEMRARAGQKKGVLGKWGDNPGQDFQDIMLEVNPDDEIYAQRWAANQAMRETLHTRRTEDDYIAGAIALGKTPEEFGFSVTPTGEPKFTTVPKGLLTREEQMSALFGPQGGQNLLMEGEEEKARNLSFLGKRAGRNPIAAAQGGGILGEAIDEIVNTRGINPDTGAEFANSKEFADYARGVLNAALDRSGMRPTNKKQAKEAINPLVKQLVADEGLAEDWGIPGAGRGILGTLGIFGAPPGE
jgi:hypothetical protein